ncbi:hypothetical protein MYMA111404_01775 [Mycoplasma marinum]|uniref:Uncharacterized protein n=1 Tax=Mycoplasma marinum TaxID=1937190 RepID=A0A4R0XQL0_9MOLU|nr:hypothetical protein [Mycoplasma marinum]TCG11878.1 hypothetical protein C4B24_00585 [Mycoplasma marinum]
MTKNEIRQLKEMPTGKMIKRVLYNFEESFNYVIVSNKQYFSRTPLEKEDIHNIFLAKLPLFVTQYDEKFQFSFKTYLCMKLKYVIFNEARKMSTRKYKVLNNYREMSDRKYQIKFIAHEKPESDLDISVLDAFEEKVYLTIFEACRSVTCAACELGVSKYIINQTIRKIMFKMKKQLQ